MNRQNHNTQKIIASFVIIVAVVLVTAGAKAVHPDTTTPTIAASSPGTPAAPTAKPAGFSPVTASLPASGIKDGTFTASSDYFVPSGTESISVTVTVNKGVISDSSIRNSEADPASTHYQRRFASSYTRYVVGKDLKNLHLPYVAGASDTTGGFNDALQKIVRQAQTS